MGERIVDPHVESLDTDLSDDTVVLLTEELDQYGYHVKHGSIFVGSPREEHPTFDRKALPVGYLKHGRLTLVNTHLTFLERYHKEIRSVYEVITRPSLF